MKLFSFVKLPPSILTVEERKAITNDGKLESIIY